MVQIPHCCGCGVGSYSSGLTPSLGPSICRGCGPKKQTNKQKKEQEKEEESNKNGSTLGHMQNDYEIHKYYNKYGTLSCKGSDVCLWKWALESLQLVSYYTMRSTESCKDSCGWVWLVRCGELRRPANV